MYKKILFQALLVLIFGLSTAFTSTSTSSNTGIAVGDPPDWMQGNWNNVMDPHGCVLLDALDRLRIRAVVNLAIQDINNYVGPAIYYTTQFYGGPESALLGPITNADLTPATIDGNQVFVFNKGVYFNIFNDECTAAPNDMISFDYNITLKTIQNTPYPIADNLALVPPFILDPDQDGIPNVPSISYAGNHDLCCSTEDIDPSPFVQHNDDKAETAKEHTEVSNEGGNLSGSNQGSFDLGGNTLYTKVNFQEPVISPNPFNHTLKINFQSLAAESTMIQLWDINGRQVYQSEYLAQGDGNQETLINTQHMEAGFYYCSLKNANQTHTFKILKLNK